MSSSGTAGAAGLNARGWLIAAALVALSLVALNYLLRWYNREFVEVQALHLALYCVAAWWMLKGQLHAPGAERNALIAIVLVAATLRGIAICAPQALSTDIFRYVWDGRVQAAGINPYRYVPADPALAALRDVDIFSSINRADYAHTIYPPFAQMIYFISHLLQDSVLMMKLVMTAFDGLTIACLIALLKLHNLPPTRVLLYAWHPLPIWEFSGSGHIDAAAIALMCLAMLLAAKRKPVWGAVVLAAATLTKYYPIVLAPALQRRYKGRFDWRAPAVFIATAVLLYLPYLSVGKAVFGFLPSYASEEGLNNGNGFFLWTLLRAMAPGMPENAAVSAYIPFALVVLIGLALWSLFARREYAISIEASMLLATVFTMLFSPHFPWYFAWLIPFICFRPSAAHIWLTGACLLIYVMPYPFDLVTHATLYVPFLLLLLTQYFIDSRKPVPTRKSDHAIPVETRTTA